MLTVFLDDERYRVIRQIGGGGMGVVFEVEDAERGERVALKTLRHLDADKLYRLKQEFRALAELSDPNLIRLHELVVGDDACFFTMELVEGESFLDFVRGSARDQPFSSSRSGGDRSDTWKSSGGMAADGPEVVLCPAVLDKRWPSCSEEFLRSTLPQLALGLLRLHSAGKVHCDIKPSNILVTRQHRLVLLDLGLVAHLDNLEGSEKRAAFGTAKYMAPEQCRGDEPTPAVDWYGMGAVLYEALTGRGTFSGSITQIMLAKQQLNPPAPRTLVEGVPRDLDELCMELLAIEPQARPGGRDILQRLGVSRDRQAGGMKSPAIPGALQFAGRSRELSVLENALLSVRVGQPQVVLISGESGIGKSALVHEFVKTAKRSSASLMVLKGRCYDRETVPFQAIDSMIDDLCRLWRKMSTKAASELVPGGAAFLRRVFPVLGRVPVVADALQLDVIVDPQEMRSRAFAALRETLRRLAERSPLVVVLDDMQWVDASSMSLLSDLMGPPDPPRLLLVMASRPERVTALGELVQTMDASDHVIMVEALAEAPAVQIARQALGPARTNLAEQVARDAAGNPFFITELAQYVRTTDEDCLDGVQLDELLTGRIRGLAEGARRVLEVVVLAGPRIKRGMLRLASGLPRSDFARAVGSLRTKNLVRTTGELNRELIEPFHDRIRDAVVACLSESSRSAHHRALAVALEGTASAEQLAYHWRGAGDHLRAADHSERAAGEALSRYDFDSAAAHLQMAVALGRYEPAKRHELMVALAEALANAGRPADAAEAFSEASRGCDAAVALELRRRSAEELVRGGYPVEGLDAMRRVLREVGFRLAMTPARAVLSLVVNRMRLKLHGLRWRERTVSDIPPRVLARIDICWSVAAGLGFIDTIHGADYQARHLRLALEAGERTRIARALAVETSYLAVHGSDRARRVCELAEKLADEVDDPYLRGMSSLAIAFVAYYLDNRWRAALHVLDGTQALFRARGGGWESDTAMLWSCFSQIYLGQLTEVARVVPAYARAAERRGDRFMAVNVRARANLIWLIRDDVDRARRELDRAAQSWIPVHHGFNLQHFFILGAACEIALYRGRPHEAASQMARSLPDLKRSQMLRVRMIRLEIASLRIRIELARAVRSPSEERQLALREARRQISRMRQTKLPLAHALEPAFQANIAHLEGDEERAVDCMRRAVSRLMDLETMIYAHAANRRLGELVGGDEGARRLADSERWMRGQGVEAPDRLSAAMLPG